MVYTSQSVSLATLEIYVHMPSGVPIPDYVVIPCTFDEALVEELDVTSLPGNWYAEVSPAELRAVGDQWVREGSSPVLKVPSAVIRVESNYLLNPEHPKFGAVKIGDPEPFPFDPRLIA